ncbi:MAG TPA: HD domain-containing protein, partial [Acidimicrobiales bacterium]|nr:HD domain-containing protein [Acidimicrobiales bacterium]
MTSSTTPTARAEQWASTMAGHAVVNKGPAGREVRLAHLGDDAVTVSGLLFDRMDRELAEDAELAAGATRSKGAGRRARQEEPDEWRTCFERDRDRILHSPAFRRLAGKTQVFIFPADHQRTRLTHALEVAQVATAIARACRLNVALVEAIALGHDCGHGPGGHASEDAMEVFVPGFDHAVWGADVTAAPLNLCAETLDGIRNHSWSRPSPSTAEGQVVGLADRIAYCAHDLEDAVHAGIVLPADVPDSVTEVCGQRRSEQLRAFISDVVQSVCETGLIGFSAPLAEALGELRRFNHERIYLRSESVAQAQAVIAMLRALVEHCSEKPSLLPPDLREASDGVKAAVAYVSGMTDRYS